MRPSNKFERVLHPRKIRLRGERKQIVPVRMGTVQFFEQRYDQVGRLQAIGVTRRDGHGEWGGRALQVALRGSRERVVLSGDDLRWALGLPSTWVKVRIRR